MQRKLFIFTLFGLTFFQLNGCSAPHSTQLSALSQTPELSSKIGHELSLNDLITLYLSQNKPEKKQSIKALLIKTANKYRSEFDKTGNEQATFALFQDLTNTLPEISRFKLELAQSYLRQNKKNQAIAILEPLKNDPEFAELVRFNLELISKRSR